MNETAFKRVNLKAVKRERYVQSTLQDNNGRRLIRVSLFEPSASTELETQDGA